MSLKPTPAQRPSRAAALAALATLTAATELLDSWSDGDVLRRRAEDEWASGLRGGFLDNSAGAALAEGEVVWRSAAAESSSSSDSASLGVNPDVAGAVQSSASLGDAALAGAACGEDGWEVAPAPARQHWETAVDERMAAELVALAGSIHRRAGPGSGLIHGGANQVDMSEFVFAEYRQRDHVQQLRRVFAVGAASGGGAVHADFVCRRSESAFRRGLFVSQYLPTIVQMLRSQAVPPASYMEAVEVDTAIEAAEGGGRRRSSRAAARWWGGASVTAAAAFHKYMYMTSLLPLPESSYDSILELCQLV